MLGSVKIEGAKSRTAMLIMLPTVFMMMFDHTACIGYEPAGLTVHPPPKMIEGGFIFFAWVSSAPKIFSSRKKWIL